MLPKFVCLVFLWAMCLGLHLAEACGPTHRLCQCPGGPCCVTAGVGGGFYPDLPAPFYTLQSVLGGNIRMDGKLREGKLRSSGLALADATSKKQVSLAQDLSCTAWDGSCLWRNDKGAAMEWYRGSGTPDLIRLKISTGSADPPRPPFAIAASPQALPGQEKAPLISDPIACQAGDGEVRFSYWTSPQVRISVCWRKVNSDSYEYCSPGISGGGPGPASVAIPGPIMQPFELAVIADNYIYNDGKYEGGFAIIDDLEYNAQICSRVDPPTESVSESYEEPPRRPGFLGVPERADPQQIESIRIIQASQPTQNESEACRVVDCDFHEGACVNFVQTSDFHIHQGLADSQQQQQSVNGTRKAGGSGTFNSSGEFAYAVGPQEIAHLSFPPFALLEARVVRFSYYRTTITCKLRILAQRFGEREVVIYEAPELDTSTRRWVQEAIPLKAGRYEKMIFEVLDLKKNSFVGLDDIRLMDASDQPVCAKA